jgi:2,3-bisphosphoglycerate-independent phosphoglycerate mutase
MDARINMDLLPRIARQTGSKILFVVLDGLGGVLGDEPTALQRSRHPHLDALARVSALGRHVPVAHGVTPGSGPGHFAIFGYDPLELDVGRGLLEALGLGVAVEDGDVAIRGNYCTLDSDGNVADRRAGRIPTEQSSELTALLDERINKVGDIAVSFHAGLQHRFAIVLRGPGLSAAVADTDPQDVGVPPLGAAPLDPVGRATAIVADEIVAQARKILSVRDTANAILLRGFGSRPSMPTYAELARLRSCCIAAYPAYRGVAALLGMDIAEGVGPKSTIADEVDALERAWKQDHDFYFLHVKGTDSAGEDGNEDKKAAVIEAFDEQVPRLRALEPDVIVVTGDHSTPGPLAAHSWHPVPMLLFGPWVEPDGAESFDEATCHAGRLGPALPAPAILRLAMASAGKLAKYGA